MRKRAPKTRIDVLETELRAAGMTSRAAEEFAHELVIHHPYARSRGVRTLAREIEVRGVEPHRAANAAGALLSVELLGQGRDFGSLTRELANCGIDGSDVTACALDGARLYRDIRDLEARPRRSGFFSFASS